MPVGRSRIDHKANRVYAVGMTKQQAEDLPKFDERSGVDQNHEEKVRVVYSTAATNTVAAPLEAGAAAAMTGAMASVPSIPTSKSDTYKLQARAVFVRDE